jgi:hypothetical protein
MVYQRAPTDPPDPQHICHTVVLLVTFDRVGRDAGAARQGRRTGDRPAAFPRPRTPHGGDRRPPYPVERCEKGHYYRDSRPNFSRNLR